MRKALVLAHEPDGGAARVAERLEQRGFVVDTHIVTHDQAEPNEAEPLPSLEGYELLVPMGSIRSLTNKAEISSWVHDELAMIAAAHDAGFPVLGVCFGGQLIAEALGGSVEASPVTEIGWLEIDGPDNPVGPGPWMLWHHDRFQAPAGAVVLATTPSAPQLFRIGNTVGTQFHPEVDVDHIRTWLNGAPPEYLAEWNVDVDALLAETAKNEQANVAQCHALVDWFLDDVSGLVDLAPAESSSAA